MSEQVAAFKYDKSRWGTGPWMQEPDRLQWSHAWLACLIVRNPMGALCGYVGIPSDHPYHMKSHDEIDGILVHGGLTYSAKCCGAICHIPEPGMPDDVWWLGFDCGHWGDIVPAMSRLDREYPYNPPGTYRDMSYVTQEVNELAAQIRDVMAAD